MMVGAYALRDNRSVAKVIEDVTAETERLEVVSKLRQRYAKSSNQG